MTKTYVKNGVNLGARPLFSLIVCGLFAGYSLALPPPANAANAAQQLFGIAQSAGGGSGLPESCDISKYKAKNDAFLQEITDANNDSNAKVAALKAQEAAVPTEDKHEHDVKINDLTSQENQVIQANNAKLNSIKAEQELNKKFMQGPSDECKRDTMANAVGEMQRVQSVLASSALSGAFSQIDAQVANIESHEADFSSHGVSDADMTAIKTNVAAVKSASATLKGFVAAMEGKSAAFVSQASANPLGTYDAMSGGGGPLGGVSGGAQSAMKSLVSSFTNLVNLFDKLSNSSGGQ